MKMMKAKDWLNMSRYDRFMTLFLAVEKSAQARRRRGVRCMY